MRRLYISLVSSCVSLAAVAQQPAPQILVQASQCLAAKTFLSQGQSSAYDLGYLIDTQSYPGQRVLYVIDFLRSDGRQGYIFAIFLERQKGKSTFDIQNNGKFKVSASGRTIDFTEPPLGGIWTQEHLMQAIRKIRDQPQFLIPREVIFTGPEDGSCRSYGDSNNFR